MEKSIPIPFIEAPLRRAIIKSANIWGLRSMYSAYYRSAVKALVRDVSGHSPTLSIFTRNSYAEGTFVPGQSDIDVAIVIHDDLAPARVKLYLEALYQIIERLRKRYPMLDHYPVYTRRAFIMSFALGPLRSETYAWQCEWGEEKFLQQCMAMSEQPELENLLRGVQVYLNGFHRSLRAALHTGQIDSNLGVRRHMQKLRRTLGPFTPGADFAADGPLVEVTQRALTRTTDAVEQFHFGDLSSPWATVPRAVGATSGLDRKSPAAPHGFVSITGVQKGHALWYLLDRPVEIKALAEGLSVALSRSGEKCNVVIGSVPLFDFFLRYVNPLAYYRLMTGRTVVGDDCFARLAPPTKSGVQRFFRYEAAKLMELHTRMGSGKIPPAQQTRNLEFRRLRLLHFLRDQEILLAGNPNSAPAVHFPTAEEWLDDFIARIPHILDAVSDSSDILSLQPLSEELKT